MVGVVDGSISGRMMKKILLIEDDTPFRKMLKRFLEKNRYEIVEAENGLEGVKLFQSNPADAVITDIIMPEQEGLETILRLRKTNPDLPIIAISGGGRNTPGTYLDMAQKFGAQHVIEKPLDRDDLLDALERIII